MVIGKLDQNGIMKLQTGVSTKAEINIKLSITKGFMGAII